VRHLWCPCRYNDRALSNAPVTNFIGAQLFLSATLCNRVAQVVRSVPLECALHGEQSRGLAQLSHSSCRLWL
jgi:hypothetical protein